MDFQKNGYKKMIPANELGSSVAESDGVRKDRKKYTTEKAKYNRKI